MRQKGRGTLLVSDDDVASYSVIVDAGSTGCRIYIYEESKDGIVGTRGPKATPGLSELSPEQVQSYLGPLVDFAKDRVPERERSRTPFKVLATAGMRLVDASVSRTIFDAVHEALEPLDFVTDRRNAQTISGQDEAYYAALAINYAYDRIDSRSRRRRHKSPLLGALDLGGASAQIAVPSSNSAENAKTSTIVTAADFEVATYLEYGIERVSARYHGDIGAATGEDDQCAPPADFARCSQALAQSLGIGDCRRQRLLQKSGDNNTCILPVFEGEAGAAPTVAASRARRFRAGSPVGTRNKKFGGGELVATSLYYYAWLSLYEILKKKDEASSIALLLKEEWPKPSISTVRKAASIACGLSGEELSKLASQGGRWDPAVGDTARRSSEFPRRCFDLAYVDILLVDVLGFSESARVEVSVEKGDVELDWTLGVVVDDNTHRKRQRLRNSMSKSRTSYPPSSAVDRDIFSREYWTPIFAVGFFFFIALSVILFFFPNARRRKKTKTDDQPCWNDAGYGRYWSNNSNDEPGTPTNLKDVTSSPDLKTPDPEEGGSSANNLKSSRSVSPVPMDAGARSRSTSSLRLIYSSSV